MYRLIFRNGHKLFIFLLSCVGILLVYLPYIYYYHYYQRTPNNDWDYFNSLALVIKSIIQNYKMIPIHDPWVCGGVDIWANPQNWVFSPMLILTLIFSPYISNVLSLIIFSIIGFWGSYKFFRHYNIDSYISCGCSLLFVNSNWFGLHFIAGHIVYRSFLLLPYLIYLFLNIKDKRNIIVLSFLQALILLDGGMYTFIFCNFLFLVLLIIDNQIRMNIIHVIKNQKTNLLLAIVIFFCISAIKTVPVLLFQTVSSKKAMVDFHVMNFEQITSSLYYFFQDSRARVIKSIYRFHEFGCYIGLIITLVSLISVCSFISFRKKHYWKELFILICFFVIATGIGGYYNPWHLLHHIPLINKAHIQSRYFIIVLIYLLLFFSLGLQSIKKKYIVLSILILVNIEFILVRNYSSNIVFMKDYNQLMFDRLIENNKIDATYLRIKKPSIYYQKNLATKECYEPAFALSNVNYKGESEYRGEIYNFTPTIYGDFNLLKYTPAYVEFDYVLEQNDIIVLNTNMNYGWRVKKNAGAGADLDADVDAEIVKNNLNLLMVIPKKFQGTIILEYKPNYYYLLIILLIIGLIIFIISLLRKEEKN